MIVGWFVWLFVAPHLYWLDRSLRDWGFGLIDLDLTIAFVLALFVRTGALPALLLGAALGRSLFSDGPLALHYLSLGLPVAAMLPLRSVFFRGAWPWQLAAAVFLAVALPRVTAFFARLLGPDLATAVSVLRVAPPTWLGLLQAAVCVPLIAWFLRRLPPLRTFQEVAA